MLIPFFTLLISFKSDVKLVVPFRDEHGSLVTSITGANAMVLSSVGIVPIQSDFPLVWQFLDDNVNSVLPGFTYSLPQNL